MKTIIKNATLLTFSSLIILSFMSFIRETSPKEKWNIPDEYKTMKNPLKKTTENFKLGKQLYDRHCASCHGATGNGDGEKVKQLIEYNLRPANFKLAEFQVEAEGVHFYKIKFSSEKVHTYKGKLPDEDIWGIVLHISTFK